MKICQTNSLNCAVIVSKCLVTWQIVTIDFGCCHENMIGNVDEHHMSHLYFKGLGKCMNIMPRAYTIVDSFIASNHLFKNNIHIGNKIGSDYKMLVTPIIPGICVN